MFWNSQVAYYEIRNNSLIEHHICDLRMDRTFAVWSATISFYLPIFLILFCTCLLYKSGSNALKRLDAGHVSSEKFRDFSPKSISIEDKNHISSGGSRWTIYSLTQCPMSNWAIDSADSNTKWSAFLTGSMAESKIQIYALFQRSLAIQRNAASNGAAKDKWCVIHRHHHNHGTLSTQWQSGQFQVEF